MRPAEVLVVEVNLMRAESVALRLWLPIWRLAVARRPARHIAWSSEVGGPFPDARRLVIVGHGSDKVAGVSGRRDTAGTVTLNPADAHALCPNATALHLWACYQGRFVDEWQEPWRDAGAVPPAVHGHGTPVLGPFPVPERLANLFARVRDRLGF